MEYVLLLVMSFIQFIAILAICSRTSHLESIASNLCKVEKQLKLLTQQFVKTQMTDSAFSKIQNLKMSDEELMVKYGITFENDQYHFEEYKYDRLNDAVNYARSRLE